MDPPAVCEQVVKVPNWKTRAQHSENLNVGDHKQYAQKKKKADVEYL